ncbi:hypothetical protein SAMD00023353_4900890 [Rosellinia necatrix]|uniref:Uncharacterized protein n=1 Tax=Rosellinia necatrix TaxID=77044 RepID=A0A1S8A9R5_ROSNE|nr:hypothetical protein SAMD00023353_4900890 [Rosellinia necatrix]
MDKRRRSDDDEPDHTLPLEKEARSAKRTISEDGHSFETNVDTMVEALKKTSTRLQKHIAQVPDRAVQIAERGKEVMTETYPPKTFEGLLDMLCPAKIDDVWTREEEERFQNDFAANPYRRFMESDAALPPKSNHNYWTMWEMIPRVRNCFPSDIIGAKALTTYGVDVDIGGGVMKPDPRWSSGFCERLTDLAMGSPCGANTRLLALLIRYVVADRLDDRREVHFGDHQTGDRFFGELESRVKRANSTESLQDIHAELRRDWKREGTYVPFASDIMRSIEELNGPVRSAQPMMPTPREGAPEYAVQTTDLTTLIKACDQTGDLGYANLSTVEQRAAFVAYGRTKQGPLQHKDGEQLNRLRIPLLEEGERVKARRILYRQRRDPPDDTPDDDTHDAMHDDTDNDSYDPYDDKTDNDAGILLDNSSSTSSRRHNNPLVEHPERLTTLSQREVLPRGEVDVRVQNNAKESLNGSCELMSSTQPLTMPEATFSLMKREQDLATVIGGTGTLSEGLRANTSRMVFDFGLGA